MKYYYTIILCINFNHKHECRQIAYTERRLVFKMYKLIEFKFFIQNIAFKFDKNII